MTDLEQYDYELPKDLIAQQPLRTRSDARLLCVDRAHGTIEDAHVRDLPDLLTPPDCLVLNDTRVIPARLVGIREQTGGRWEGLFLEADEHGLWRLLGKTRGKLAPGESIMLIDRRGDPTFRLQMVTHLDSGEWIAIAGEEGEGEGEGEGRREREAGRDGDGGQDSDVHRKLERVGRVPLPPYIRRGEMTDEDMDRYQTVYARWRGAVAAPTAGLHFTKDLLIRFRERQITAAHVTLHVGIGTFRPIVAPRLEDHAMHAEWCELREEQRRVIDGARDQGGRVIAVGTTVVRTLETAAAAGRLEAWSGPTDLFIRPPYPFRAVDGLLTNFHLPKSSLLVLVRAFGGDRLIRKAYDHAIAQRYRFFSYGDAMLIL